MWFSVALATASFAAAAPVLVRHWQGVARLIVWLAPGVVVALTPCLVPIDSGPWRFLATLWAICLLVKLYDSFHSRDVLTAHSPQFYLTWLPNAFWLVLSRPPASIDSAVDRGRLRSASMRAGLAFMPVAVFALDWSRWPFQVEHCVKVTAAIVLVVAWAQVGSIVWRLGGGTALDFMANPIGSSTPAEFWRCWNLPAQQLFKHYVFRPCERFRHPLRALIIAFAVSGLIHEYVLGIACGQILGTQLAFFLIQGCATAMTAGLKPKGWMRRVGQVLTIAFNLLVSTLFFQGINEILPFYSVRACP